MANVDRRWAVCPPWRATSKRCGSSATSTTSCLCWTRSCMAWAAQGRYMRSSSWSQALCRRMCSAWPRASGAALCQSERCWWRPRSSRRCSEEAACCRTARRSSHMCLHALWPSKVQRIIEADGLVERCREQGAYLERCLQALVAPLPLVGNVRGRGLFWGVELVADKQTKRPLARTVGAAAALHRLCLDRGLAVYPPARAAPTKAPAGTMSC